MASSRPDASKPPTPTWVIDEEVLGRYLGNFQRALATHWPNSILGYSFKTNSLPWLISYMREHGAWAETVSDSEYDLALALGFAPDRIVFNGPIKGRDRFRFAMQMGSIVNLDSKREVAWASELAAEHPDREFAVGLRANWDLLARSPGDTVVGGLREGRFGFDLGNGEFDRAIADLTAAGVRVAGLHMHRNSLTQSAEVFRALAVTAGEIIQSRGLTPEWVDVGGGFFGREEGHPTFDDYVATIRQALDPFVDAAHTRLIVEPGASLVAVPFEFHASVLDTKKINDTTFLVTDASRTDIDPLFRRQRPFAVEIDTESTRILPTQVVGGFTLMEDDRITVLEDTPELQVGDRIEFLRVGGYTMCLQTNFIEFLPAVHVRSNGGYVRVRRPWGVRDVLQGNSWWEGDRLVDADTATELPAFPAEELPDARPTVA